MIYIKKFNNNIELNNYLKSNFISPHIFYENQTKSFHYLEKYKRIEYLGSDRTQYIDLDIIPDENTGLYIKAKHNSYYDDEYLIGLRNNNENTRWCIGHNFRSNGWYFGYGTYDHYASEDKHGFGEIKFNYLNDKKTSIILDGNFYERNVITLNFIPQYNIRLFGTSGIDAEYAKWTGNIYECKITQGNKIVYDLIPIRIGNIGYMYDKISNKIFGNKGTGNFILGPDI